MKKRLFLFLKVFFGVALFFYIFYYKFDFSIFKEISFIWFWFVLLFVNSLMITLLRVIKWDFLLCKFFKQKYSFKNNWHTILIGQFFAFFTPSRLGDLVRVKYIKKELGYKKSLAAVLADRLFDLGVMLALAFLGLLFWWKALNFNWFYFLIVLMGLVFLFVIIFLIFKKKFSKYYFILKQFLKKRIFPKKILIFLFLTLLVWFLTYTQFFVSFLVLKTDVSFINLFWLVSIGMVIIMLPISINGIGVREYVALSLFPLLGVSGEKGVIVVWLVMLVNSVFPAALGYLSFVIKKKS